METPFCFGVLWGVIFKNIFASRQPNHVKHWLSGLYDLLKYNFQSLRLPTGDPQGRALQSFFGPNFSPDFVFFPR